MSTPDVQQAVLVQFPTQDVNQISQRLALFDEVTGQAYPFVGEPWIAIQPAKMLNGWKQAQGAPVPQYRKRPNGQVEMRGRIQPGTVGKFFTLPEGYGHQYGAGIYFPAATNVGTQATVEVKGNGDISVTYLPSPAPPWIALSSVTFSVD